MVPTKNLVGHQRLRLTSRKPLLSLQHAVDVLLNNLYTNLASLHGHHICKVWLIEYYDRQGQGQKPF